FVAGGGGVGGEPVGLMSFAARITVPLVAPEAWAGISTASRLAEVAAQQAAAQRLAVLQAAAQQWVALQRATGQLAAAQVAQRGSLALMEVARDRQEVGAGTHLEVVRAELQAQRDGLAVLQAQRAQG